jgi:hypothetical protein
MTNSITKQEYTTVGDLIDQLKQFDRELPVTIRARDLYDCESLDHTINHPLISTERGTMNLHNFGYRPCVEIRITDGERQ